MKAPASPPGAHVDPAPPLSALASAACAQWSAWFEEFHGGALGYASTQTRSRAQAEDLTAEAFVRLLGRLQAGAAPTNVRAYLYATIRHLNIDHSRRHGRLQSLDACSDDGGEPAADDRSPVVAPPEAVADMVITHIDVERVLAQLTVPQARVLKLRYLFGLSTEEIAAQLGMQPNAVGSLLYRAKAAFLDQLGTEYGDRSVRR